jgi:hypothetical protein
MRSRAFLSGLLFGTIALATALTFQACTDSQPTGVDADPLVLARGGGGAGNPSVYATDPTEAPRGTTLDVRVLGANFDDGSTVTFKLGGKPTKKVKTNSTSYVSTEELVANITIEVDADTALYDVEVMTSRKRKGIGTEMFRVKAGKAKSWTELEMCAKRSVIDQINSINEGADPEPWLEINSTDPQCECGDWPRYCPTGTLTYSTAGPVFEWRFSGTGFVPIDHRYVLVYSPDPWPGRNLTCLGEAKATRGRRIHFSGSMPLPGGLTDAKIWIVRQNWVDCEGDGFERRTNPWEVPRLTNDRDGDETSDVSESCAFPFGTPPFPCDASKAYDWLFENALIQYNPTGGP